jgi:hypothetical protein
MIAKTFFMAKENIAYSVKNLRDHASGLPRCSARQDL